MKRMMFVVSKLLLRN